MALLGLVQVKVSVQGGQVSVGLQKDYYKIQATTFSIALTLKSMSTQWSIFICGLQKCFHSSLHDFLKYACQIDLSVASTRGSRFMDKTQLRIKNQTSLRICASFERCAMFLVCQDKSALLKKTHLLSLTLFISNDIPPPRLVTLSHSLILGLVMFQIIHLSKHSSSLLRSLRPKLLLDLASPRPPYSLCPSAPCHLYLHLSPGQTMWSYTETCPI